MDEAIRYERLSLYDHMTSVMNRTALSTVIDRVEGSSQSVFIVNLDLNGLKAVNDRDGHEAGDRMIIAAANCMSEVFGQTRVFRTGGDEFVIVLEDYLEDECIQMLETLKEKLKHAQLSAAIGYVYRESIGEETFKMLQEQADRSMYQDKAKHYELSGKKRTTR